MKLNLGCGDKIMPGWINVDSWQRSNTKLDIKCDLSKEFPFQNNIYEFVLMEHLLEHLEWLYGLNLLGNCYKALKTNGKIRILVPDYKKLFQKYLENDVEFFKPFIKSLNDDLHYYSRCYEEPTKVRKERVDNMPPKWHLSKRFKDRRLVKLRCRYYTLPIEALDWFVHQYHEHKCLYDFLLLKQILEHIGFRDVKETENDPNLDTQHLARINSSLRVEAVK